MCHRKKGSSASNMAKKSTEDSDADLILTGKRKPVPSGRLKESNNSNGESSEDETPKVKAKKVRAKKAKGATKAKPRKGKEKAKTVPVDSDVSSVEVLAESEATTMAIE